MDDVLNTRAALKEGATDAAASLSGSTADAASLLFTPVSWSLRDDGESPFDSYSVKYGTAYIAVHCLQREVMQGP